MHSPRARLVRISQTLALKAGVSIGKAASTELFLKQVERLKPEEMRGNFVRIGPDGDGGYVIPDVLEQIGGVISPGVGNSSRFEHDLADRGIPGFLLDATVSKPPEPHAKLSFLPLLLGPRTSKGSISLSDSVERSGFNGDLILQIDIEGDEFGSLCGSPTETLQRFRVIVIEIHRLAEMTNHIGTKMLTALLDALLENHVVVHNHGNTEAGFFRASGQKIWDTQEVTLIRRDFFRPGKPDVGPALLDKSNT